MNGTEQDAKRSHAVTIGTWAVAILLLAGPTLAVDAATDPAVAFPGNALLYVEAIEPAELLNRLGAGS